MKTDDTERAAALLRDRFGIRRPANAPTEAELRAHERQLHVEARRDRLLASPIRDSLGVDASGVSDEVKILRDKLEPTLPLRSVQKWVRAWSDPNTQAVTKPWLVLSGGTGTGKTLAAAWAIAEVGGRYIRFPEAIQDHRALTRKASLAELETMRAELGRKYGFGGFLVIDELGIEGPDDRDAARVALAEIAERRQRWHQRTLVLTNRSAADIRDAFASGAYDPRTLSRIERLLVSGGVVDLAGRDLRRTAPPARKAGGAR